ncbi:similar to Saccharomyces cerevisiae YEL015W EDC3 Non-essential conserved protein of unknown function [Maudiozyma barnettii]|uniref:Enhancer of mRNA-decapping protein 3 n=1 Tax=Maudiozyma barnettii TaxID=61262 RepID=A0A8H2VCJ7_9SACH|nr:Edc3p [Kazachstania barnettii]CAB4252767.1 similar to Saccharomyces cerevisiae YEL015W EDC3 Non-essential conserved protein of unknown function [Kazachstania barnettii]CAD1780557.1 similar to Saccharomyces cerevisiae YEL015W EDC3 Non-essential conserved protein of unknown function [Kazachstania barnettii]
MSDHSQFTGYSVQLELRDGKLIQGKIVKANSKGLTLSDVTFGDGGTSQAFKVRSSRLKDLKVLGVPQQLQPLQLNRSSNNNSNNSSTSANNDDNNNNNNNSGNGNRGGARQQEGMDWQDDDVGRIKNGADFDFQSNLTLFNKKDVFAQLKREDEVDPEKRLVSFNKKGSPDTTTNSGTSFGRGQGNYEYDEMVIPNAKEDSWNKVGTEFNKQKQSSKHQHNNNNNNNNSNNNNDDDDDDDVEDFESATDEEEDEISSGANSNRKRSNIATNNEEDDTEDDDIVDEEEEDSEYYPITKSINITHLLHSAVDDEGNSTEQTANKAQLLSQIEQMLINNASNSSRSGSVSNGLPTLKNSKTGQLIPMASPVELLEIERLTNETFGITTGTMNEIFGNNASYLVKQTLGGPTRLTVKNTNPEPLIVVLVSDMNRSGIKAIALSRYLCQLKQVRVVLMFSCPLNDIQDKYVLNKIEIFKNSGGKLVNSLKNLNALLAKLNSPVELIIDAMQGFDSNLSDFTLSRGSHQKILEIVNWCNETKRNKNVKIWSIDLPSGYDSSSGLQNFDVCINKVDKILCSYSWPLSCLKFMDKVLLDNGKTSSLQNGASSSSRNGAVDSVIVTVDCGIPTNVYSQKNSLRKFSAVDTFVSSGVLGLTM